MVDVKTHSFIFQEGHWIGEGKIVFSSSPEFLKFYTRWTFPKAAVIDKREMIRCTQDVEMQTEQEHVQNHFTFSDITDGKFVIELENDLIGYVSGTGVYDEKKIAWEFRGHPNFEGFEVYEIQDNGDYMFHAEYVSPDQFRSIIDGRVWKKASDPKI